MFSANNAEYTLPYFIENFGNLERFIDSLDIRVIGDRCELLVYLKTINKNIRWKLLQEKQFSRVILKDKICAIFSAKEKDNVTIFLIYKAGIKGCSHYTLEKLYKQQKVLAAQKSNQDFFVVLLNWPCKDGRNRLFKNMKENRITYFLCPLLSNA